MIQLNNINKSFGARLLFEDVTLSINFGERVGLVGRNGAGKSTLFKILLGDVSSDGGTIKIPKGYKLGSLSQHIHFDHETVIDECMSVLPKEMEYETYRAEKLLFGLGFEKGDLLKSPHSFSGGYQIRINLVKTLLQDPDCLLLDEPTNYLDIVSLRWLRQFLKSFDGEVVIITHDRDFMDSIVTHVMGISRRRVKKIRGNTQKFYDQIKSEDEIHEQTRLNTEKKVQQMMEYVDKYRAKARGASQAQSKLKMIDKMDRLNQLESESDLSFSFNLDECPAKVVADVKGVTFGYNEPLFQNVTFTIGKKDRIGVIGKNGKGKSTFLNVVAQELIQQEGEIWRHNSLKLGHFGQTNVSRLHPENNIIQEVMEVNDSLSNSAIRGICGTMMFSGDDAEKKISVLSGGEKARVLLGKILAKKTNLLLLDEPTNHLDMESVEALIDAVKRYNGACLVVTHSEDLLRKCVNKLVIFREGGAEFFDGTYDEFLEKIGWEAENQEQSEGKKVEKENHRVKKNKNRQKVEAREKEIYEQIETLESFLEILEKDLNKHAQDGNSSEIEKSSEQINNVNKKIETLFAELEELHD